MTLSRFGYSSLFPSIRVRSSFLRNATQLYRIFAPFSINQKPIRERERQWERFYITPADRRSVDYSGSNVGLARIEKVARPRINERYVLLAKLPRRFDAGRPVCADATCARVQDDFCLSLSLSTNAAPVASIDCECRVA